MRVLRFLTGGLLLAAVSVSVMAGSASAATVSQVLNHHAFTYNVASGESTTSQLSTFKWYSHSNDSPVDHNHMVLRASIAPATFDSSTPPNVVAGDYVVASSKASRNLDRDVSKMPRMGFDFKESNPLSQIGERISVILDDGTVAYLDAFYCNHTIGSGWGSANFTGFRNNCSFYDSTGTQYSADGTHTAWQNFVASHSGQNVVETFLVVDGNFSGTTRVSYSFDRLFLGTGQVWDDGKYGRVA